MPRVVDHDKERERLLDAGFRLLVEEGYAQATMRRLASAGGVSTGALYHYFPDKQAILWELFELTTRRDTERIRTNFAIEAPLDMRIKALYTFYRDERSYLADILLLVLEVHRQESDDAARARVLEAVAAYRSAVGAVLALPEPIVRLSFSLLVGNLVQDVVEPDGLDVDGQEAIVLSLAQSLA